MGDAPTAVAVATVERRAALRWKRYMDPESNFEVSQYRYTVLAVAASESYPHPMEIPNYR